MPATASGFIAYCQGHNVGLGNPTAPTQRQVIRLAVTLGVILADRALVQQLETFLTRNHGARRRRDAGISASLSEMHRVLRNLQDSISEQDGRKSPLSDRVRELIPDLSSRIQGLLADPPFQPFGEDDAKATALVEWFKLDFMRWVDPIKCPTCNGSTRSAGSAEPTAEERIGRAGRVELHECTANAGHPTRRFARYNDLATLMKTREGRCGEFANLFCLCLGAYGLNARYVWNSEDHVWTEYWSEALRHWVHVDSCEAAVHKPLLYASGWGKKQAFCIAAGPDGMQDVTRAYVEDWTGACQDRRRARGWAEKDLRHALEECTAIIQASSPQAEQHAANERTRLHSTWLDDDSRRLAEAQQQALGGRQSGPEDWREARQETGSNALQSVAFSVKRPLFDSLTDEPKLYGHIADIGSAPGFPAELTSGPSQTSAMFTDVSLPQTTSFTASMTFQIDLNGGGADGLAMVFSGQRQLGLGGYGMGYSGIGEGGDFAVEIDTYPTEDHANDPPTPHISIHSPPNAHHRFSLACAKPSQLPPLADGEPHELTVIFDAIQRRLQASIDGKAILEATAPLGSGRDWFMGVTAACGGLYQAVEIAKWSWTEIDVTTPGEPDT